MSEQLGCKLGENEKTMSRHCFLTELRTLSDPQVASTSAGLGGYERSMAGLQPPPKHAQCADRESSARMEGRREPTKHYMKKIKKRNFDVDIKALGMDTCHFWQKNI